MSRNRWHESVGLGSNSSASYHARASSSLACTRSARIPAISAASAVLSNPSLMSAALPVHVPGEIDAKSVVTRPLHGSSLQRLMLLAARRATVELDELGVVPISGMV